MKLIINISEDIHRSIKNNIEELIKNERTPMLNALFNALFNGTPLPKGHGRLIDADKLKTHFICTEQGTDLEVYLEPTIIDAPTIIEADKEVEE